MTTYHRDEAERLLGQLDDNERKIGSTHVRAVAHCLLALGDAVREVGRVPSVADIEAICSMLPGSEAEAPVPAEQLPPLPLDHVFGPDDREPDPREYCAARLAGPRRWCGEQLVDGRCPNTDQHAPAEPA